MGNEAADDRVGNRLLRALTAADRELLIPFLEGVSIGRGTILETGGRQADYAYFLQSGLAVVVARSPHRRIGVGVVGNDGMTGLGLVLDADRAVNETVVQSAGTALRMERDRLRTAMERSANLRRLLLRYAYVFMVQTGNTSLANGHASMEQRLARWILMSCDRCKGDLDVTHKFISLMVGVRRAGITVAMHSLEGRGLVRSTRANVHIADRAGLITLASDYYGICEEEYERLIGHFP